MSTKVTVTDGVRDETVEIDNNYVLVVSGTAYQHDVVVHRLKDGTQAHVITIKGIQSP